MNKDQSFRVTAKNSMLYVLADDALRSPLEIMAERFQTCRQLRVVREYGPSGALYNLILSGVACDVYYSGDWSLLEKLERQDRLVTLKRFLSSNTLLTVSQAGQPKRNPISDFGVSDSGLTVGSSSRFASGKDESPGVDIRMEILFGIGALRGQHERLAQKFIDATFHHIDEFLMSGLQIPENGGWETCRETLFKADRINTKCWEGI